MSAEMVDKGNGWDQYQRLVLDRLDDLKEVQEKSEVRLRSIETEIALLRLKSSLWGAVAGTLSFAITYAIQFFASKKP